MEYLAEPLFHGNKHTEQDEECLSYAMQLVNSSALPMCLHAATQIEIFEIIAKAGPDAKLSAQEIAAQLPTQNPDAAMMLDSILRLLAGYSVLGCSVQAGDHDRLIPRGSIVWHLCPNSSSEMKMVLHWVPTWPWFRARSFWIAGVFQLKDAILEGGIPFNRVHGTSVFEYAGKDPMFNKAFNTGMLNLTSIVMKKILEAYKGFEHLNQVVDVGGGLGICLSIITSKYPSIKGINFDHPHVIQHAPPYPGVEHVGGDMFESVPKGDAIFMKSVLHDWGDEQCFKLLKNCYEAIPDDGKVIVVEVIMPVVPETNVVSKANSELDVLMRTFTGGGKERTKPEFQALATKAGFGSITFECFSNCNFWVMELFK